MKCTSMRKKLKMLLCEKIVRTVNRFYYYFLGDKYDIIPTLVKRTYCAVITDKIDPIIAERFIDSKHFQKDKINKEGISLIPASSDPISIKSAASNQCKTIQIGQYLIIINIPNLIKEYYKTNNKNHKVEDPSDETCLRFELKDFSIMKFMLFYCEKLNEIMYELHTLTHDAISCPLRDVTTEDYCMIAAMMRNVNTQCTTLCDKYNGNFWKISTLIEAYDEVRSYRCKRMGMDETLYSPCSNTRAYYDGLKSIPSHYIEITPLTSWICYNTLQDGLNYILYLAIKNEEIKYNQYCPDDIIGCIDVRLGSSDDPLSIINGKDFIETLNVIDTGDGENFYLININYLNMLNRSIIDGRGSLETVLYRLLMPLTNSLRKINTLMNEVSQFHACDIDMLNWPDRNGNTGISEAAEALKTAIDKGLIEEGVDTDSEYQFDAYISQCFRMAQFTNVGKGNIRYNSNECVSESRIVYGFNETYIKSMAEKWMIHMNQIPSYYPRLTLTKKYTYRNLKNLALYYEEY